MIIVAGEIRIAPADHAAAKAAAIAMQTETVKEDGCIRYRFWADLEDAGLFHVYEEWTTTEALAAHGKSAHMGVFRQALAGLDVQSRDIWMLEAGERQPLG